MLNVGTAVGDVHRITWAQIDQDVHYARNKTGVAVDLGLHTDFRPRSRKRRVHVTIINTAFGKPFSVKGFGQWMRAAMTKAGLPLDAKPHGLRKALGRRLAEAGCAAHEIMAVPGHKTLAEAERYTREADRRRGGRLAVVKRCRDPHRPPRQVYFDLFAIVKRIVDAGASFKSLAEPWADTGTSTGRLMIAVLGGLADVERDLIRTRTAEGRARAKSRGQRMGRPSKPTGTAASRGNASPRRRGTP